MESKETVEQLIYEALKKVTGQALTGGSLWLVGSITRNGDAAAFDGLPSHFVDGPGTIQHCAGHFGVMLKWEDHQWIFSQAKAWRDEKECDDAAEVQRVLEAWLAWLTERELRLLVDKKVGFGKAKEFLDLIDKIRKQE